MTKKGGARDADTGFSFCLIFTIRDIYIEYYERETLNFNYILEVIL